MSDEGNYSRRRGPRDRQLRVGNAERDAVADILRSEHLAGRLDNDEFDERVAACLAAKTYAELDELIGDLPAGEPDGHRATGTRGWRPALPLAFLPLLVAAIVLSHGRAAWLVVPFFVWFVVRPFYCRGPGAAGRAATAGAARRTSRAVWRRLVAEIEVCANGACATYVRGEPARHADVVTEITLRKPLAVARRIAHREPPVDEGGNRASISSLSRVVGECCFHRFGRGIFRDRCYFAKDGDRKRDHDRERPHSLPFP